LGNEGVGTTINQVCGNFSTTLKTCAVRWANAVVALPAGLDGAVGGATIVAGGVAVVALFAGVKGAIATFKLAFEATIARRRVAIIALFFAVHNAIAT
jgi:hypothetical protein